MWITACVFRLLVPWSFSSTLLLPCVSLLFKGWRRAIDLSHSLFFLLGKEHYDSHSPKQQVTHRPVCWAHSLHNLLHQVSNYNFIWESLLGTFISWRHSWITCTGPQNFKGKPKTRSTLGKFLPDRVSRKLVGKLVSDPQRQWVQSSHTDSTGEYQCRWYDTTGMVITSVQTPGLQANARSNCTNNQWITSVTHLAKRKCKMTGEQKKEGTVSYS